MEIFLNKATLIIKDQWSEVRIRILFFIQSHSILYKYGIIEVTTTTDKYTNCLKFHFVLNMLKFYEHLKFIRFVVDFETPH